MCRFRRGFVNVLLFTQITRRKYFLYIFIRQIPNTNFSKKDTNYYLKMISSNHKYLFEKKNWSILNGNKCRNKYGYDIILIIDIIDLVSADEFLAINLHEPMSDFQSDE